MHIQALRESCLKDHMNVPQITGITSLDIVFRDFLKSKGPSLYVCYVYICLQRVLEIQN